MTVLDLAGRERRSGEVFVRGGSRMTVSSWEGEGATPLLFVHGFGDGAHVWDSVVARLERAGRCVAPDLLGHGDSDHDRAGRYAVGDHAADVAAVRSSNRMRDVVLVGHSMGGAVALHAAVRHPSGVAGLVLVDCGPRGDPIPIDPPWQVQPADRAYDSISEYRTLLGRLQPLADGGALDVVATRSLRRRADGLFVLKRDPTMALDERLLQPAGLSPIWGALAAVDCPVLVLRGAASALLTAAAAERMRAMGDDVRLETIAGAGHAVMTDDPAATAAAIDRFVATLTASHRAERE